MNTIGKMAVAATAFAVLNKIFGSDGSVGISRENTYTSRMTLAAGKSIGTLKRIITRHISEIIGDGCEGFKIGKTGNPDNRAADYAGYSQMWLLCKSRSRGVIEALEAYYNGKYIDAEGNDNRNAGSAGIMSNRHRVYYLYIVIR
ncbi:MAG: hypothetical protein IJ911_04790 [Salinivirgaceae bacterium]|nr:hypothetical protein [Salinivirgaceae bacterium]